MTMPQLQVDACLLCDYITSSEGGKSVLVGVYAREVVLAAQPPSMIPLFLHIGFLPLTAKGVVTIRFVKPDRDVLFSARGDFDVPSGPSKTMMIQVNLQIPPVVPYPGDGTYSLVIGDENGDLFSKDFKLEVGVPSSATASFNLQVKLGA